MTVRRVAILTAMVQEMRPLTKMISFERHRDTDLEWHRGRYRDLEVVALVTGIGTRAARAATEALLDANDVGHILMVGIAGSVDPGLTIGEMVDPDVVVDHATGAEFHPTISGRGRPRGALLTTDVLLNDPSDLAALRARGIVAVDMETAAVGAVCDEHSLPWSVCRAISDRAGDPGTDTAVLGLAHEDGSANLPKAASHVLRHPTSVPHLARLGRGMKAATGSAARAAVRVLDDLTRPAS